MGSKVVASNAWNEEDYIWFWSFNYNGLFRIEKKSNSLEWVASYPEESLVKPKLCEKLLKIEDNVVLASWEGELRVIVYNCIKDEWKVIKFPESLFDGKYKNCKFAFGMCVSCEKYIYVIGHMIPIIVRIDIENYTAEYIMDWRERIDIDINKVPENIIFFARGSVANDIAYIPFGFVNAVLELELKTGKSKVVYVPTTVKDFNEGTIIDGELWLTGQHEPVLVIYNLEYKNVMEICLEDSDEKVSPLFYRPIDFGNKVLIFAARAKHSYWIDKKTKQSSVCKELEKNVQQDKYAYEKYYLVKDNMNVHYWSWDDRSWHILNVDTGEEIIIDTELPKSFEQELNRRKFNYALIEKSEYRLQNYIFDCQTKWMDREYYSNKTVEIILLDNVIER